MRKHTFNAVGIICAAAGLVASMGTASAAPSTPSVTASAPYTVRRQVTGPVLVDCFGHAQVRPGDFILACGDGNSRLLGLRWTQWGTNSATAEGINAVNDCKPYCAVGRFRQYPVVVRLDRPGSWTKHPQLQRYSRITLTFQGSRPDGSPLVVTYPLWAGPQVGETA